MGAKVMRNIGIRKYPNRFFLLFVLPLVLISPSGVTKMRKITFSMNNMVIIAPKCVILQQNCK